MNWFQRFCGHFSTVHKHRKLVRRGCFKVGLYWQGLTHDLSKYSWTEFRVGVKYYQGFRSPNNAEREEKGYTSAWLHHKGRNKHHMEYWIDYSSKPGYPMEGMKMPKKYVVEMLIDRISASKVYQGDDYKDDSALNYYNRGKWHYILHEDSKKLLEELLTMVATQGEEATYKYIREKVLSKD
ncbi:MAG: DUF5662 family protein [Lachnospiraceae bacterium]|nr:DUF5662 family protein [Lachnospiraceae bacterium]